MIILGVDIGTTKSAAVLVDSDTGTLLHAASEKNNAGTGRQSVPAILNSVTAAVQKLPIRVRQQVQRIGITGQMHGVICWGGGQKPLFENWQSTLALDAGLMERIRNIPGCTDLCAGYGFSSLAVSVFRKGFRHAGTIMDYLAAILSSTEKPVMEASNAASWGLWNFETSDWDRNAVARLNIPEELLPQLVPAHYTVGHLCSEWAGKWGLGEGICIKVPIGDNPAAIIGTGGNLKSDLFMTIGTGAQLAFSPVSGEEKAVYGIYEKRPFPGEETLYVKAPLCGGKAIELLAGFLDDILKHFSCAVPMQEIYKRINEYETFCDDDPLKISTHFMGERDCPGQRGNIENIGMENFTFRGFCCSWLAGILDSLLADIPVEILDSRRRIILNGNAIRRSPLLLQLLKERVPDHEVIFPDIREEAACGAAFYALI